MEKQKLRNLLNKTPIFLLFFILLSILSVCFITYKESNNVQSSNPVPPDVVFVGDYKIGDGEFIEYEGQHIPINYGQDVTLKGYFMLIDPSSEELYPVSKGFYVSLYLNHINVKVYDKDGYKGQLFCEVKAAGESSCGETFQYCYVTTEAYEDMTFVISNPHVYGNANAVDDMLSSLTLYYNTNFELMILKESMPERSLALLIMFCGAFVVLVGLFSNLLHVKKIKSIIPIGFSVLFAGLYMFFCTKSISLYFDFMLGNTIMAELAAMFYYLFITKVFADLLCYKNKILANIATIISLLIIPTSIIVTLTTELYFYDMWLLFAILQGVSFILLTIGIIFNIKDYKVNDKIVLLIYFVSSLTFLLDSLFSSIGVIEETLLSQLSFLLIFIISIITILVFVPKNVNNAIKNKQLENEKIALNNKLQDSKILLMISQIQPHFLYNMLNTIYHLCDKDVELAKKSIDDFSTYLRNNINSLSTTELILFNRELEHIKTYAELEKIRFGEELQINYDIKTSDFYLPILSIQPLVENAIKHGK